ncbi:hypothetical protein [Marinirhabdus gelatinilytica]|uniref:Uncharacterized protein n=1 Tax=Marinirhabdus gelatinilytica TaxID=1703343 RepID=A0A370QL66_9FLAO|nr:hypothetical protein [Marinirhabdus gelatinilytica]RDK89092.1 hypothetical protein C8D94_101972 [Marinirhabdus gelatinilytica]
MKNFLVLVILSLSFLSCKNLLFNAGLSAMGVYDEEAKYHLAKSRSKVIVILPTHHIGTPEYYADLKSKIDSLAAIEFYFYVESVNTQSHDDSLLRKFRKFSGNPIPASGYKNIVDSVLGKKFKIKFKKEIIDQPSYPELGVPSERYSNVDATLEQLVGYYENRYGPIQLDPCDFETEIFEETSCKKMNVAREVKKDVIEDFRNEIVLNRIDSEKEPKIVLIYGDGHTPGLISGLKVRGFLIQESVKD